MSSEDTFQGLGEGPLVDRALEEQREYSMGIATQVTSMISPHRLSDAGRPVITTALTDLVQNLSQRKVGPYLIAFADTTQIGRPTLDIHIAWAIAPGRVMANSDYQGVIDDYITYFRQTQKFYDSLMEQPEFRGSSPATPATYFEWRNKEAQDVFPVDRRNLLAAYLKKP